VIAADDLLVRLLEPLRAAPWSDLPGFWLQTLLRDRFLVVFAIPLALVFRALPAARLGPVFVVTGVAFIAYFFGALYATIYLGLCLAMHAFGEQFARESARTDVLRWGAPLFAWTLIGGGLMASFYAAAIPVPDAWEHFAMNRAPWLLPYGLRGVPWEPDWRPALNLPEGAPVPLFVALGMPHLVGTAYLAIRMLQYLSEIRRGTLAPERRGRGDFLAWVLYAPNLMQGPIERYDDFHAKIAVCPQCRGAGDVLVGVARIGLGLGKGLAATLYVLPAARVLHLMDGAFYRHPEQVESTIALTFGVYVHMFWLYLEFSGYCDISAGIARIFGYRQVENFHWPWLATSLRDFWRRWHISLSFIARDYVYIALGGNRRHATLNLCLTFAFIGVWHAPIFQFVTWGLLMGLLVSINQGWVQLVKRIDAGELPRLGRVRRAWLALWPLPQICAWALTMHVFMYSMLAFFGGGAISRVTAELIGRGWALITQP